MITKVAQLTCDLCGKSELIDTDNNTAARIQAQDRGWKFMSYQNLPTGNQPRLPGGKPPVQAKQIDACPGCRLPMPDELVKMLTEERTD